MKIWKYALWAILLSFSVELCRSARILGILPVVSRSHYMITRKIMTTLALRGHQVTVISGIEEKQTFANYTHIYISEGLFNIIDTVGIENNIITGIMNTMKFVGNIPPRLCSIIFGQDHVKKSISSKLNTYDVIVTEFDYYPCYLMLAANLNVPIIWFDPHSSHYPIDYFTGNPNNPAYIPSITSGLSKGMSFVERLMNFYEICLIHYYQANIFVPAAVDQFNKLHNAQVTFDRAYQLPDLAFVYSHFTLLPRPSLGSIVEISGIHIEEEKPLPQMKIWKYALRAILLLFYTEPCRSARILGVLPLVSKSHYSIMRKVMTTLALRGHQVTVISGIEEKQTFANYTHIYISGLFNIIDAISVQNNNVTGITNLMKFSRYIPPGRCSLIFGQDHVKEIVSSKFNIYDIIVTEFGYYPCYLPLAIDLDVPIIWFDAHSSHYPIDYFTGNSNNPAYIPSITSGLSKDMSFVERLMNFYEICLIHYYQANIFVPAAVDQFNKLFNAQVTIDQLYRLPDLAVAYNHFTLLPRPNLRSIIEISGIHIEEEKPLPQDIKEFIDKAEHGVIFFSFGTTLKCDSIPEKNMQIFKEVFSRITQKVLWRCNIATQVTVPDNVMIRYWFPQRDILAHKNVRAFISHGGILGIYEAIYTATPLIGIPFIYDQHTNIRLLEKSGAVIRLNFQDLTSDVLFESINEIINNSKYKENMERLSVIFKDRPMSPLDTAIYWTEYVIRHKGAPHLRSAAARMPLYRYLFLDVIGFLAICVFLTLYFIYRLICKLSNLVIRYNF